MTRSKCFFALFIFLKLSCANSTGVDCKLSELNLHLKIPNSFIRLGNLANLENLTGGFKLGDVVFLNSANDKRIDIFRIQLKAGENIENNVQERKEFLKKANTGIKFLTDNSGKKINETKQCFFHLEYLMPNRNQNVKAYCAERYFRINEQEYILIFYHTRNQNIHSSLPTKEAKNIICSLKISK